MNWIENGIQEYYNWLKDKTFVTNDDRTGWSTIYTPFIGLFNDAIEIYAKKEGEKIILSDDGLTLNNLDLVGVSITRSPQKKDLLKMILLNYGVSLVDKELQIYGTEKDFPQKKHNLICAILEISEMEMMVKHTLSSTFKEDVRSYLDEQDILYTPQFITKGSTGIEFNFDFQIAGKKKELVIQSFTSLNQMNVPRFLFGWEDIKPIREKISGKELKGLAIVNDEDTETKLEYIGALASKGAEIITWSKRHTPSMIQKLIA